MRIDSLLAMMFMGLVLSDRAARALGSASRMFKSPGRRGAGYSGYDSPGSRMRRRAGPYLEKLAKDYEIIPLMSKLI